MPPGGLNIRLGDQALAKEARLHDYKRAAILAFARANKLDRIVTSGGAEPEDRHHHLRQELSRRARRRMDELGIDEVKANQLGMRLYKVGMTWPLEPQGVLKFAEGLDLILVIEEKRSLIETQVKEQLYDLPNRPRVLGKKDENEQWLFPAKYALDPSDIAIKLGERLIRDGAGEDIKARVAELKRLKGNQPATAEAAARIPYFCPGCPHNSSTVVPEGSRAYAGIGCHYMAHWMDRTTEGFTQMGGEGTNWIGEAPFSKTPHVFQNLGDGTYIHSGSLAIRAARAAGVNMTFKILYNDAVAMTGGQTLDGGMTVPMIVNQVLAEGIEKVVVVTDEPRQVSRRRHPAGRARLPPPRAAEPCRRSCARSRASPCWSTTRPAPPRSAAAASAACSPIPTSACSSIRPCARAAATAASSRTAWRWCRWRPSSAPSAPSTSRPATRTSPASTASARASSRCTAPR